MKKEIKGIVYLFFIYKYQRIYEYAVIYTYELVMRAIANLWFPKT